MKFKIHFIALMIVVAAFIAGATVYQYLPDQIASHWNALGEVDGYMRKFWGVFLLPVIMIGIFGLYWLIPKIDPLKANIESFKKQYNYFFISFLIFMLYVFSLKLVWNLGIEFDFSRAMIPALSVLWYMLGMLIGKSKRNWFIGIRTPWTLSNDYVWDKTHALGGKLYKLAGAVSLIGIFFGGTLAMFVAIAPIIAVSIMLVIYSYFEFRKITK